MDQVIKGQWVAALRSGEYQQTENALHADNGYCCLGVLCDLAYKADVVERRRENDEYYSYGVDRIEGVLPDEVQEWAGLDQEVPYVEASSEGDPLRTVWALSELNDGQKWDFNQIADVIEAQL